MTKRIFLAHFSFCITENINIERNFERRSRILNKKLTVCGHNMVTMSFVINKKYDFENETVITRVNYTDIETNFKKQPDKSYMPFLALFQ